MGEKNKNGAENPRAKPFLKDSFIVEFHVV
jgi:hypothetical protein